jgi:peptidyl-prolyl cis-trans isomerase SurA
MSLKFTPIAKLALVAALFFNVPAFGQGDKGVVIDKIVAKVDNYIVLKSELERTYAEYLQRSQYGANVDKCKILESMIINKVLVAKAEIDSVIVDDATVESELDRRMRYFISQVGSEEKIQEYYGKSVNDLKQELRQDVREQLTAERMQNEITMNASVTPSEVKDFYERIPNDSLPYYSTEVEVAQIVKFPEISKAQKQAVRNKLNEIRDKVLNGEDFGKLAERYSEDPASAQYGGEIGFFKRGELAPEYEATALQLKEGEISKPVESDFGFHIIQLIERRGNEFNTRHILMKPGTAEMDFSSTENYLDSLRTQIKEDKLTFAKAAKEYSDDQQTAGNGGFFSDPSTNSTQIPTDRLEPEIFFAIDTMEVGTISKPIRFKTQDGKQAVRILYYKKRVPPHQANLKQDYQKIYQAALNEKKNKRLSRWFDQAKFDVYIKIDQEYDNCNIMQQQ